MIVAIILGIIEGLTEFLPVSSTGHLIVASRLLAFEDPSGTFEIVVQLGAILALLWFYRKAIQQKTGAWIASRKGEGFAKALAVAFLPAALLGVLLEHWITAWLFNPVVVSISLIVGGLILLLVESKLSDKPDGGEDDLDAMTARQALLVGAVQILSLVPGVSRSGATIVGGLISGLSRRAATEFSFWLAIPTLGGATVYKLVKELRASQLSIDLAQLTVGTFAAFLTALIVIHWFLKFVSKHSFRGFAWYRIVAGIGILVWFVQWGPK